MAGVFSPRMKRTDYSQQVENVQLIILKSLRDLVRLQTLVLDASLIQSQTFDGNAALAFAETLGRDGRIREEDEQDDAPGRA